jgi:hypothetical protein
MSFRRLKTDSSPEGVKIPSIFEPAGSIYKESNPFTAPAYLKQLAEADFHRSIY